ncbi:MAG: flavin reductase family protein [Rhodospirillales bacterium]|nr:flavin reductase family protein [Rhodospirillales bacterium]
MFYEPDKDDHGLAYNPYKACVVPRPIGWITTISVTGIVNLAPFSQFNSLNHDPPFVMFSGGSRPGGGQPKDTVINAERTGEFVVNMATWDLREAVNTTSWYVDPDVDEFELAGLEKAPSRLVKPPRVAASPIHFECKYHQTLVLPANSPETLHHVVIGRVIGVHIRDDIIMPDGKVDIVKVRPLARLGYMDYTSVDHIFEMPTTDPKFAKDFRKTHMGVPTKKRV